MQCNFCGQNPLRFSRRVFPRLDSTYLICRNCGRAQRRPAILKTKGRGIRPLERDRFHAALSVARAKVKFQILVWGPVPGSDNPAESKRLQIRNELQNLGHHAFFSEEMTEPGVPTNVVEFIQIRKIVNLVINVAASHGSSAEFENYGVLLGRRHLVFLNERARGGFTATGTLKTFRAAGGLDEFFKDDDLHSCALTLAATDWVLDKVHYEIYLAAVRDAAQEESLLR